MSDLKYIVLKSQWPDGTWSSDSVPFDCEEFLAVTPAADINICDEEGNPRKDTITFEEVEPLSQTTVDSLFDAWSQLRNIVARYETTLQNRWSKKSSKQRMEILLQAWPKMSSVHRPDFDLFRKECETKGYHRRNQVATDIALRFPIINTEDLALTKPFLLMLASRSRSFPCVFANADRAAIGVGIRSKMLIPKYIRGYTMYLNREFTREGYGRLVSWEKDRQAISKCYKAIAPDPGTGLLLLEIQRDILELLVACSVKILHVEFPSGVTGFPIHIPWDTSEPPGTLQPQNKTKTLSALTTSHDSATAHALEAPYQTPDTYDFTRLKSFIKAKCHEVEDHFLLAREDPAYFAELIREACSHTKEAKLNRQYDPESTKLSSTAFNEALCEVLITAYSNMFYWQAVSRLFDQLMMICTEQRTIIRHGEVLPDAYSEASSRLAHVLDTIMGRYLDDLPNFMAAVPTFNQQICKTFQPDGRLIWTMNRNSADYLYWLFTELTIGKGTQQKQQICGLSNLTQEIENLITKDKQQKKRLTRGIIRLISDVAVIAELQRQLGLSSCTEYILTAFSSQKEKSAWEKSCVGPLREINDVFCDSIWSAQESGFAPLVTDLRVFKYPSDKPRTAANTEKMRSAEHALDVLWERVDERVVGKTGKTLKEMGDGKIQHRDIQRTPPWTDPRQSATEIKGEDRSTKELDLSLALSILEERTESTIDPTKPSAVREKVKTRGLQIGHAQTENPSPTSATNINSTDADQISRLFVRKKAFNTFAALFGKLSLADKLPGELPWTDFKKAMVNVGFGAEKLQGSGWLFESKSSSIIFHEPHPHSKLPMQWARRIARRLNRNFGWTIDTFVLEDGMDNDNASSMAS
ncbi:MAG: hypothetical protein Q9226_006761 [Calogaya cf. arnoldii]